MKQVLAVLLLFCVFYTPIFAVSNNRFGIHILFPEEAKLAAELVNSNGGDWGYVVIPIQATDRNRNKWQGFMDDCRKYHLIPIIRLATFPIGSNWTKPNEWESVDFANFFAGLNWPTKKKIIAVYNEPNHSAEWGGEVNPFEYAEVLSDTIEQFKQRSGDFVMLNAGLDASAPNSTSSMDEYEFMSDMIIDDPEIFRETDGFNSHSYPNPAFSAHPNYPTRYNITSYQYELSYLQNFYGIYGLDVYITETGWRKNQYLGDEKISQYFKTAYDEIWTEDYIKVVAPFLLQADAGAFEGFSIMKKQEKGIIFQTIAELRKNKGAPDIVNKITSTNKASETRVKLYEESEKDDPIKFKWLWKKIVRWVLK
jgi:hypothetical protein